MKHLIQRNVIDVLSRMNTARYSDIIPADMDGNQFAYHLKQLIQDGLVAKNHDGTYQLTEGGRAYLIHRYENLNYAAHTIFLVALRHKDMVMLRTRKVQPQLGMTGLLHGEPTADEDIKTSIAKRIFQKTNLHAESVTILGSGLIKILKNNELLSYSHAVIVTASVESIADFANEDETGINFWITTKEATGQTDLIPSTNYILDYSGGWFDLEYNL